MRYLFPFTLLLLTTCCLAQVRHQSLIVAEFRIDSPRVGNYTYLVSYNFANGSLISKDTIFGAKVFNKEEHNGAIIRYDLRKNFIYKNRYVVSGSGNIIDTHSKSMVVESSDDFVEALGDTLIFHRANAYTGKGFLMLDLKKRSYGFVNHEEWNKTIILSPDKKHRVFVNQSKLPYRIMLSVPEEKDEVIVDDAGHGPNITSGSFRPTIEIYWLSNNEFIYDKHEVKTAKDNRLFASVKLYTYNIQSHVNKLFNLLDTVEQGNINGVFFKDEIGQLIYRTSGFKYLAVDTAKRKLTPYPFYELGFNFSVANRMNEDYGRILQHKGEEIGRYWCSNELATKDMIAIEYGRIKSNLGYPKGFMAWSVITKTWQAVDVPWLCRVIGWINKED
jgi:hypothetical protein